MVNLRKYPRLWLLFGTFFILFCRLTSCTAQTLTTLDGHDVSCRSYKDLQAGQLEPVAVGITCPITCEDGSTKNADLDSAWISVSGLTYKELQGIAQCDVPSQTQNEQSAPVDQQQQQQQQSAQQPAIVQNNAPKFDPYLSEKVTACDLSAGYINFQIDSNAPSVPLSALEVQINGDTSPCSIPANNSNILTCAIAKKTAFPAQILVTIDGDTVNDFSYNGDACVAQSQSAPNPADAGAGGTGGSIVVPACDPHLDPSCPVDCSLPANADLCK